MGATYRLYVLVVLLSATAASVGCGQTDSAATMPAATQAVNVKLEPNEIVPAFDDDGGCVSHRPFDLRFLMRLDGPPHIAFHRLQFKFKDRFGRIETPRISTAGLSPGAITPNVGSIPIPSGSILPNSTSIPMPSAGILTSFGSARDFPLSLRFGCGIAPSGTLIIIVDFDDHGRSSSSETHVNIR